MAEPPPPAPPPPPPPPPAPPPPAPLAGGRALNRGNSSKMRNFNWEAIPHDTVLGKHNIWTAERKKEYELDTKRMEELFSRTDQPDTKRRQSLRKSLRGAPGRSPGPEVVSILGSKKNMNIGIFLKQFRRSVKEIIEDISHGRSSGFGSGKLEELLKLLPDSTEVKQLLAFKGDHSTLSEADQFMVQLVKVPRYEERLRSLVLKEEFPHFMDEVNHSIDTMTAAGKELLDCADLHSIIRLVLKTGNYMNDGGYAGSAVGFRMTSLLKLADTKANKPGMNLMHYVVMQAQKSDASLLKFPEQLRHIGEAARIHKQEIESEFQRKVSKVQEAKTDADKQADLAKQMKTFFQHAESRIAETEASFKTLNAINESVAEYFCEEPGEFKLDECCSIFHSFCERFKTALQENMAREMAEVKRRQRERLQSAAKRRSTATCSARDKDMEGIALESVLQRCLGTRGSRRLARTPSPNRFSIDKINSKENCPAKDSGKHIWNLTLRENKEDSVKPTSKVPESKISSPPWKKAGNYTSAKMMASEDDEGQTEEEVQKLREASQKVLRYQSSRSSVSSGEYQSPVTSPRKWTFQEDRDKLLSVPNVDSVPTKPLKSPLALLRKSSESINRRHTISLPTMPSQGSESEDELFIPSSQANGSAENHNVPLGSIGKMKSVESYMPPNKTGATSRTSDVSSNGQSKNLMDSSEESSSLAESSEVDTKEKPEESSSASRRSNVAPKKNTQTREGSRFLSFFKRLGERGKTNNIQEIESSSVDP